ncbi:hypothetical protein D3C71_1988060 [compost metagenome]
MMAGWCCAMAASMAGSSSSKSGVSATPTKSRPCSWALIGYMTKPGMGASMVARWPVPGCAQANASKVMSSSEPLPSTMP